MPSEVARHLIGLLPEVYQQAPAHYGLTPHETRLLTLLVANHNFRAVAVLAGVKPSTVAWHMQRIYEKLQVHSKSEADIVSFQGWLQRRVRSFGYGERTGALGGEADCGTSEEAEESVAVQQKVKAQFIEPMLLCAAIVDIRVPILFTS